MSTATLEQLIKSKLEDAKNLVESDPDIALGLCNEILNEDKEGPGAQQALFLSAYIMLQAERYGMAYHIYERCAQLNPNISTIFSNMGMCLEDLDPLHAKTCYQHAQKLDKNNFKAFGNEGLSELVAGNPRKCIQLSQKALKGDPDLLAATHNMGLAQLMLKDWKNGWRHYFDTIGSKHRQHRDYGVPDWNGEKGTVLVYGEQGVGDEILYASCIKDLMRTNKVVLDVDGRLVKLFNRSFDCPVYGDRFKSESDAMWEDFDYSCAIGQLPCFFRRDGAFDGSPYLKCDDERRFQWRSLFDTFPGRKIGIAWNGGLKSTGSARRSQKLDDFTPLFSDNDTFISLDYAETDDRLKCYPEVLKGRDIDDMAPLVAELDLIVTCTTTVVHLAGALGVPCYVLVPQNPPWIYGVAGDYEWNDSVYLVRQEKGESWKDVVSKAAHHVKRKTKHLNLIRKVANA